MEHVLNYIADNGLAIVAIIIAVASYIETKRQSREQEDEIRKQLNSIGWEV